MPPTNEELSWWHEVISWGWAIVVGVIGATSLVVWRTRGIIAAQEALAEGQKLLAKNHCDLDNNYVLCSLQWLNHHRPYIYCLFDF